MVRLITAAVAFAAVSAYGWTVGAGVFGGVAMAEGDMAAPGRRFVDFLPLEGGDAGSSAAVGGRALVGITPALSVELAVAYHPNHPSKSWRGGGSLEEPKLSLVPITAGGRYTFAFRAAGFYLGAGGGYFLEDLGLVGGTYGPVTSVYYGEVDINAPGAYVAGGLTYRLWKLELEAGPRFTAVWNKGEYDYTYEVKQTFPPTYKTEVRSAKLNKDFNDTFVDLLVGLNYYFI
jgi:hypothetical protein